ncbi:ATP phosphoribosyltransferase regulatory subunit [Desulfuribacillus alkaliarsenatis]|uniref:ATP phosphoribosyltransferase regulatory subunit n=1 Tax=Desulfuribacillus alkaliarsenatis TaxID=766136 RepID=A0A1E5G478_9FIRM|nr:ATP phosphoribosyltransferase regulatory subunit [Desulfuribacillus alkaliarsenatis]OEF97838.1 ATP phosphoribosyltransferase regulatory subunit [Desulfuribacillus alkaliarsenatis]
MAKPLVFEKPLGVRDYLPGEVRWKKEVERRIGSCLELWGYQEIITPALEYFDTIGGCSNILQHRLYKLIDRNGKTLVLRPDMTTPIARVVASLLKDEPLPMRLCYNTSIYRMQEKDAGKDAEFFQSGVELIGSDEPYADAEVVALAAEALKAAGLDNFKIAIGETSFLDSFLNEKAPAYVSELKQILIKQDYVGWSEYVKSLSIDEETRKSLLTLPKLQGDRSMIAKARTLVKNEKAINALIYLDQVWDILENYDVSKYMHIDFTTLRGQDYYTGMIFEVYAPPVGFPICGGGRYNDLISEFGRKAPAVGFGIWVERLIEALSMEDQASDTYLLLFNQEQQAELQAAIEQAKLWRQQGYKVEVIGCAKADLASVMEARKQNLHYAEVWDYDTWSVKSPASLKGEQ